MKLIEKIEYCFETHAGNDAISSFSPPNLTETITFRELREKTVRYSSIFSGLGLKAGDLVMIYMNKSPLAVQIALAVLLNSGIPSFLNSKLKSEQVFRLCKKHKPNFIAIDKHALVGIAGAKTTSEVKNDFLFFGTPPFSATTDILLARASRYLRIQIMNETDGYRPQPVRELNRKSISGKAVPGFCLFTSGSTGEQKGVLIPRDDLCERAMTEIHDYGLDANDCLLSLLPFSFDVGLNQLFSCLFAGAHLVIMNSWFPKDIMKAIKTVGITGISGVPAIWADMISLPKPPHFNQDARTLRYITVSGGDLSGEQLKKLGGYWGNVKIFKTYGQTETFRSGILKPHDFEKKMTSVGKAPKGVKVFILDVDNRILGPNTEGEIVHSGVGAMAGYRDDQSGTSGKKRKTPNSLKGLVETGEVVYTGDHGKIDKDGYLYILGRKDGMVKISGNRVYPKEIENCLLEYECVKKAAVVSIVGTNENPVIIAEIVTTAKVAAENVSAFLKKRLPSYMVPSEIHIARDFPVTETGKTRYSKIREKYEKKRFL